MYKLVVQALGLLLMLCVSLSEIQAVNINQKSEAKAQIKTHRHRYVGDPMLMQASEPTHLVHNQDQSVQLAQMTSESQKMNIMTYEMDTGMVVLIVILTIIIVCVVVFCCCWCIGCCIFAAAEAERERQ